MDWIKKNYDRFALLVLALALLGSSGYLAWQSQQFPNSFSSVTTPVPHSSKLPAIDDGPLNAARESLAKPAAWSETHPGSLFVSLPYIVVNGTLVNPAESDIDLHPPVKNKWLIDHHLELLDGNVLNQDPDGDGFSNLDEFVGATDPNDKNSHPGYLTKLRLKEWIRVQFRLKFAAYDESSFQINTLDLRQPSSFVKLGETIPNTKFKILKFTPKKVADPGTGGEKDVSELTIQNLETEENVTLILDTVVNSPDSYALFKYLWDNSEMRVKREGKFVIKPETDVEYKLVDIHENEAVIRSLKNSGPDIKIPRLEAGAR